MRHMGLITDGMTVRHDLGSSSALGKLQLSSARCAVSLVFGLVHSTHVVWGAQMQLTDAFAEACDDGSRI